MEHDGWNYLLDGLAGCAMLYLALFGTGKIIFGETRLGLGLLALASLAGVVVGRDLSRRKWKLVSDDTVEPEAPGAGGDREPLGRLPQRRLGLLSEAARRLHCHRLGDNRPWNGNRWSTIRRLRN